MEAHILQVVDHWIDRQNEEAQYLSKLQTSVPQPNSVSSLNQFENKDENNVIPKAPITREEAFSNMTELILDAPDGYAIAGDFSSGASQLLVQFPKLNKCTLNQIYLRSFQNFPYLPTLKILEACDNLLRDDQDLILLAQLFPNLRRLELGGNHFKSLQSFSVLVQLPHLQVLGLESNPVTQQSDYRQYMFSILPNLEILDQVDRNGNERIAEDEEDEEDETDDSDDMMQDFLEGDRVDAPNDELGDADEDDDDEDEAVDMDDGEDDGREEEPAGMDVDSS